LRIKLHLFAEQGADGAFNEVTAIGGPGRGCGVVHLVDYYDHLVYTLRKKSNARKETHKKQVSPNLDT